MTESGWYVRTSEDAAISEAAKYLEGVDVDAVLGERFTAAVEAVFEVNARGLEGAERLQELRRIAVEKAQPQAGPPPGEAR